LFDEFVAQRAADATVLRFKHRAFGDIRTVFLENFDIDVDASHVVGDKGDFSQGKKQDIAVKVLTDYAERAGGARGLEN
jgi:hypothetical protein